MALLTPIQRLVKNLRQEISNDSRSYMTKENAYLELKARTGQDFGYDACKWEEWLTQQSNEINWRASGNT